MLMALLGPMAGCGLVMDVDFDKYEAAGEGGTAGGSGAGGAAGAAGSGGSGAIAGAGGTGPCEPLVTINEIQTHGAAGPEYEFIELFNNSPCAVAADEYELIYRSATSSTNHGVKWRGATGRTIEPWAHLVISSESFPNPGGEVLPSGFSLSASGGGLALERGGEAIDQVGWGEADNGFVDVAAAPAPGMDESIARIPDGADSNDNFADFRVSAPSPGAVNPSP